MRERPNPHSILTHRASTTQHTTALLCAGFPSDVPYMTDEAMQAIPHMIPKV